MQDNIKKIEKKVDKFIFWFCIVDIMFLPYAWFLTFSWSLPITILWLLFSFKFDKRNTDHLAFFLLVITMVISTVIGNIFFPSFSQNNIIHLIKFIQSFTYFLIFKTYLNKYHCNLKPFLISMAIFIISMAVLFVMSVETYQSIRLFWNQRGIESIMLRPGGDGNRYGFIWMDVNNVSFVIGSLVFFLLTVEKVSAITKFIIVGGMSVVVTLSMSRAGTYGILLTAGAYLLLALLTKRFPKLRVSKKTFLLLSLFAFVILVLITGVDNFINIDTFRLSIGRFQEETLLDNSRIDIFIEMIGEANFFYYIATGFGGEAIVGDRSVAPHNGHLYWILSYGFISYLSFLYLVFRKRKVTPLKQYLWILPLFVGFTANIMIGEVKISGIMFLLIAASSSELYLSSRILTIRYKREINATDEDIIFDEQAL